MAFLIKLGAVESFKPNYKNQLNRLFLGTWQLIVFLCVLISGCTKSAIDSVSLDLTSYDSYLFGNNFFDTSTYLHPDTGAPQSLPTEFEVTLFSGEPTDPGNIPGTQHKGQVFNASEGRFIIISGLTVYDNYLYLSDKANNVIKRFDLGQSPAKTTWFLGNGRVSTVLFDAISPDQTLIEAGQIITGNPGDLAATKDYLYFVGSIGRIARFNLDGTPTHIRLIPVVGVDNDSSESQLLSGVVDLEQIRIPYPKGIVFSKTTKDFYTTYGASGNAGNLRRITLGDAALTTRHIVNFLKQNYMNLNYEAFVNAKALSAVGSNLYLSDNDNVIYKLEGGDQAVANAPDDQRSAKLFVGGASSGVDIDGSLTSASFSTIAHMASAGDFLYITISDQQSGGTRSIRVLDTNTGQVVTPTLKNPDGSIFSFPNGNIAFFNNMVQYLTSIIHHKNGVFYVGSTFALYKLVAR